MVAIGANLPTPTAPIVDPSTGIVTQPWWYYFQRMFARTGGGTGGDFGPATSVTVGTSPFRFTAPSSGFVLISGGGVSRMRFSQSGTAWYDVGSFYGSHPMTIASMLEVTYQRAPVVTFVPG